MLCGTNPQDRGTHRGSRIVESSALLPNLLGGGSAQHGLPQPNLRYPFPLAHVSRVDSRWGSSRKAPQGEPRLGAFPL